MMEEEYKYAMTEDEMLYLTIHIQKITEDHKRLKICEKRLFYKLGVNGLLLKYVPCAYLFRQDL